MGQKPCTGNLAAGALAASGTRTARKTFASKQTRDGCSPSCIVPALVKLAVHIPEGLRVLATSAQRGGVGLYQIVSINGGTRQGIKPGNVFAAFRKGQLVDDRTGYRWGSFSTEAEVRLPDEYDATLMVFRTFEDISYGMVLSGSRAVLTFDMLRHPDERL